MADRGPALHISSRTADVPASAVRGSERRACEVCGCEVWYDPKSRVFPNEVIICYHPNPDVRSCFSDLMDANAAITGNPWRDA